jgi:hypothetical protein
MPRTQPGDPGPGFMAEPGRCWTMIYDHKPAGNALLGEPVVHGSLALAQG